MTIVAFKGQYKNSFIEGTMLLYYFAHKNQKVLL